MAYKADAFQIKRHSKDSVVNKYGMDLVELCTTLDCHIMNGRSRSDPRGDFTCYSGDGASVVDYCLCSSDMFNLTTDFAVITRCESDHLPIQLTIHTDAVAAQPVEPDSSTTDIKRYRWIEQNSTEYRGQLTTMLNDYTVQDFTNDTDNDIDDAVTKFSLLLTSSADVCGMQSRARTSQPRKQERWYDQECADIKRRKYKALDNFRIQGKQEHFIEFRHLRNKYRNICRDKRKLYEDQEIGTLVSQSKNSKGFWNQI